MFVKNLADTVTRVRPHALHSQPSTLIPHPRPCRVLVQGVLQGVGFGVCDGAAEGLGFRIWGVWFRV